MSEPDLSGELMAASLERKLFGGPPAAVKVGRFVVLEKLGQGGMGVVFAVYDNELDRKVALKLLLGDPSADLRFRLQREARAMAQLSHPNVVPVFEVGEHEGQLFIVLEFVEGPTLQAWVGAEARSAAEILEKYQQAGHGLEAAHAAGIVHRDFKPANAIVGARGRVRVLDFGLARAGSEARAGELVEAADIEALLDTPLTATGSVVGTPAYMAPEQFRGEEVDHRSDQFSFCISVWEALTGERPFPGRTAHELMKAVSQGELRAPPRPVPPAVRRVLARGLRSEPEDRWPSMTALLAELSQDVTPRRGPLRIVGATATLTLVGGLAWYVGGVDVEDPCVDGPATLGTVWNAGRRKTVVTALTAVPAGYAPATSERVDAALARYADAWLAGHRDACEATRVEHTQSAEVMDRRLTCLQQRKRSLGAVLGVLETTDAASLPKSIELVAGLPSVGTCADLDYVNAAELLPDDPATKAAHERVLDGLARADALRRAGRYEPANELGQEILTEARELDLDSLVSRAATNVASTQTSLGDVDAALASALEGFALGDATPLRARANSMVVLAQALGRKGRHAEAAAHARRAYRTLADTGGDGTSLVTAQIVLAQSVQGLGKFDEAQREFEAALQRALAVGPKGTVAAALVHRELSGLLEAVDAFEPALIHANEAITLLTGALGPDHPDVAAAHVALGIRLSQMRRETEARAHYATALEIQRSSLAADHPQVGTTHHNIALSYEHEGKYQQAIDGYDNARRIWAASYGPRHPNVAIALGNIGGIYEVLGEYDKAAAQHREAIAIQREVYGDEHPTLAWSLAALGSTLIATGAYPKALTLFEQALAIEVKAYGENHRRVAADRNSIAEVLCAQGRHDEAVEQSKRAIAVWSTLGPEGSRVAWAHLGLAFALSGRGEWKGAVAALAEATAAFDAMLPADHADHARPAAATVICATRLGETATADDALHRLRSLADHEDQPPFVAALLDVAEAIRGADATAQAAATARLQQHRLTRFTLLVARARER